MLAVGLILGMYKQVVMSKTLHTVNLLAPTLVAVKPCMSAKPAGILGLVLAFRVAFASEAVSFSTLLDLVGLIIVRFARFRSRRSRPMQELYSQQSINFRWSLTYARLVRLLHRGRF